MTLALEIQGAGGWLAGYFGGGTKNRRMRLRSRRFSEQGTCGRVPWTRCGTGSAVSWPGQHLGSCPSQRTGLSRSQRWPPNSWRLKGLEGVSSPWCSGWGFPSTPEPHLNLAEMGGWSGEGAEKPRMPTPSEQPARGFHFRSSWEFS